MAVIIKAGYFSRVGKLLAVSVQWMSILLKIAELKHATIRWLLGRQLVKCRWVFGRPYQFVKIARRLTSSPFNSGYNFKLVELTKK